MKRLIINIILNHILIIFCITIIYYFYEKYIVYLQKTINHYFKATYFVKLTIKKNINKQQHCNKIIKCIKLS